MSVPTSTENMSVDQIAARLAENSVAGLEVTAKIVDFALERTTEDLLPCPHCKALLAPWRFLSGECPKCNGHLPIMSDHPAPEDAEYNHPDIRTEAHVAPCDNGKDKANV